METPGLSPLHETLSLTVPEDSPLSTGALGDEAPGTIDACSSRTASANNKQGEEKEQNKSWTNQGAAMRLAGKPIRDSTS